MSPRSLILWLLLALAVLLVLVVVAATYLLVGHVLQDQLVVAALRWALAILAALVGTDFALLIIVLAVDRLLADRPVDARSGEDPLVTPPPRQP